MNERKVIFPEPIVMIRLNGIRFPRICPVCGQTATETSRIVANSDERYSPKSSRIRLFGSMDGGKTAFHEPDRKIFLVPVCERHAYSHEDHWRYRAVCMIIDGIILGLGMLTFFVVGESVWSGRTAPSWTFFVLAGLVLALIISYGVFRPRPIEQAMKIVGFDLRSRYIWLQFKHTGYRDELIKENPMNAELVSWIVRGSIHR